MSGRWQQCLDTNTGQPYYWNTASNQVSWDCPPEFSLPPPQLVTNISLATPSNPVTSTSSSSSTTTANTVNPTLSSLVSGYDSEDSDDDESGNKESQLPGGSEAKDDFIGPVIPKQTEEEKDSKRNVGETDDILSLIEAEKPPDYADSKAKLPSCKTNSRDKKESVQANSMLALANYDDSDEETEAEKGTRLDQYGRLVFNPASRAEPEWQTAEQREALLRYRMEEQRSLKADRPPSGETEGGGGARRFDNSRPGSRKRRLDLPKGKFNKTENLETETETESEKQAVNFVPFVKSSSVLPGTIESHPTNNGVQKVEESAATETEQSAATDDVGELTAELVEKMEHFKVGQEKVSALKTVAIKLETLYSAWNSGALSLSYLQTFLESAMKKLSEAESRLTSPPRAAVWDRDSKSYQALDEKDVRDCTSATETNLPTCSPNPPPSPPAGPSPPPLPPSPPPPATGADHQIQDMDIEEEPTGNITDQLSMFYSEIEGTTPTNDTNETTDTTDTTNINVENYEEESNNSSAPSSPPASPLATTGKKRKKVKVSNNLALKKKGVGDMLVKWQKIKR